MLKQKITVRDAFESLNSVCDGAKTEDRIGFNKFDAEFAREIEYKDWNYNIEKSVYKMLEKYRNQLRENFDIEYDEIEFENEKEESNKIVDEREGKIIVKFDYDAELVDGVKNMISRRKYNPDKKWWEIFLNKKTIKELRQFVKKYKFEVTDNAVEKINNIKNNIQSKSKIERKNGKIFVSEGKMIIKFNYDPKLVEKVKRLSDRKYDPNRKQWEVPFSKGTCEEVIKFAKDNNFDLHNEVIKKCKELKKRIEMSKALDAEIEVRGLGNGDLELRPFQRAGVKYAVEKKRVIIADKVGLGKTVQSLATIQKLESFPALVICPAFLKLNWGREIEKWLPHKTYNIIDGESNNSIPEVDIQVINYDILHHNKDLIKEIKFESVIIDEIHYIKNHKSIRSKTVLEIVDDLDIPVRLGLSATPIKNRPVELVHQLNVLDRLDDLGGFWKFVRRYCAAHKERVARDKVVWNMKGSSNREELNERLRETCYIRRDKQEVLTELPDVNRVDVPLEIDNRDDYEIAEENLLEWIAKNGGEDKVKKAMRAQVLVKLNTLRRLAAEGKKKNAVKWIENFLETGEKLIVFAHHKNVVKDIAEEFNALRIDGDTSKEDKQKARDKFQNDENEQLIVISLQAGGEGITLTEASNVVFVEMGWTPTDHDQAVGRCYGRLNDVHGANSYYLIAENTVDEDIRQLLREKRKVVEESLEGIEGENDVVDAVVDKLLSK